MSKILLIGHARHGKDTVAKMIQDITGAKFQSSSIAAAKIFLFDRLKDKYGYKSFFECFDDRVNHRKEWHDLIADFNKNDKTRLAKEILKENDIYVGMRSNDEVQECLKQGLFDVVIGVFDPNKPLESKDSFDIDLFGVSNFIIIAGNLEKTRQVIKYIFEK